LAYFSLFCLPKDKDEASDGANDGANDEANDEAAITPPHPSNPAT
jgi:hypothetical protein